MSDLMNEHAEPENPSVPQEPQPADGGEPSRPLSTSGPWDIATKRTVLIILFVALIGAIWISRDVLPLVIVSGIIAFLLSPIVDLAERLRIPRSLFTIVLFLLLLTILILIPIIFAPVLVRQLISLGNFDVNSTARLWITRLNTAFLGLPNTITILGFRVPLGDSIEQVQQNIQSVELIPSVSDILTYIQQLITGATTLVSSTAIIGFNVVGGIFNILIAALVTFFLSLYLTKDAPVIRAYVEGLFPSSYQSDFELVLRRMSYIWSSFFRGQLVLSITVGFMVWIALALFGMPGALLLGILAGLMEVIPNIGPILSMIPAVIIALIQGSSVLAPLGISNFGFALIVVGIYFVIQQLENNILVPRIIGSSVNIHPVIVIIGVVVGLNVGGILGALLAAPIIASLRVLGSYIHAKLLDYPPFQNTSAPPKRDRYSSYRRTVTGDELKTPAHPPAAETASASAYAPPGKPPTQSHESVGGRADGPLLGQDWADISG
jgi:predicted PurR-regulated permease PerM